LSIYEIRALDDEALALFENPANIRRLGASLAGLHWEADFAFLFFAGEAGPEIGDFLNENPNLDLRQIHRLTYGQWQDGAGAAPFQVAGLWICGPGREVRGPGLLIDPGLAFGFGGHPTTRGCLEFLARACRGPGGPPRTALDLGSGTGVLSLAAACWGVAEVLGVDYSHLAVQAAQKNLKLNRLEKRVSFRRAPAQDYARHPGEILLANLHLALQEELFRLGAFQGRGWLIVSGLLPGEGDRLLERLEDSGFRLIDRERGDRWITMFLGRKPDSQRI
jgi:ribosomal protein L11 methyltransferase